MDEEEQREERRRLDQEKRDKEYREKQREDNEKIIRAIINSVNNIFTRQRNIDDPVIRYALFVDKLSLSLDIMFGIMTSVLHDDKNPYSDDILSQTQKVMKIVQDELVNLMNHVRSPSYSPDAQYGKNLVENMSSKFQNQCNGLNYNNCSPDQHYSHHPTDKNLE